MIVAGPQRETPLERQIKQIIARDGPMSVPDFMSACLHDEDHGYYRKQPAIGSAGDFVTAPEISQVFGELIGLWCAVVWQQMGAPARVHLVELGPGRGTMMRDMLRAVRVLPEFRNALHVYLVDRSETLQSVQQATLAGCGLPVHFTAALSDVPAMPTIVVANEFLDTMPIEQFEFLQDRWHRRRIATGGDERLCFHREPDACALPRALPGPLRPCDGDVYEVAGHDVLVETALRTRAMQGPFAALFIDYGHARTGFGDTLQGVSEHKHVSPLHAPGETDLSAQVDFQCFASACGAGGLAVDGPVPQAEFLGRLGIVERASRLMAANPVKALDVETQVQRLMAPSGMGSRFLAIGVRSPELAPLPALA